MGEHSQADCAKIRDQFASLITSVRAFLGAYKTEIATGKFTECRRLEAEINGKVEEMKKLFVVTLDSIQRRVENGGTLTKKDLRYLYEVDGDIPLTAEYEPDPRILEFLRGRDAQWDAEIIFDGKIARNEKEITAETKAYFGPMCKRALDYVESIYTYFPDRKIYQEKIEVDYGKSLKSMIEAGEYDNKNDPFDPKKFPRERKEKGKSELEVIAADFMEAITTKQIEERLDQLGLRSATIEELLAVGVQRPDFQRKFWIVALGSGFVDFRSGREAPCLTGDSGGRNLYVFWDEPDSKWDDACRFLAVRK